MYEENLMELERKRARRYELKKKLADSCNARKEAKERGDEKTVLRERIRESQILTFINRINGEIAELEKVLGVEPEGIGAAGEAQ